MNDLDFHRMLMDSKRFSAMSRFPDCYDVWYQASACMFLIAKDFIAMHDEQAVRAFMNSRYKLINQLISEYDPEPLRARINTIDDLDVLLEEYRLYDALRREHAEPESTLAWTPQYIIRDRLFSLNKLVQAYDTSRPGCYILVPKNSTIV